MRIKTITFDFWGTLGLPNPHYPAFRTKYLAERYNLPEEKVNSSRKQAKNYLDKLAVCGIGFNCLANLSNYLWNLTGQSVDASIPYTYLSELFIKHPPIIFPDVMGAIRTFKENRPDIKIGIISNTNFISGSTISKASLHDIPFNFKIFSDEVNITKPNPKIFQMAMDFAGVLERSEVLHIGDSLVYDAPATDFGFQFRKVNHPTDIINILNEID